VSKIVNIHAAKTKLSSLIAEVEQGGEVVIARAGKPVAKLVPIPKQEGRSKRRNLAGLLKGKIRIGADFDEPLPEEILAAFRGERP
jgi:prevent-host-death family protein